MFAVVALLLALAQATNVSVNINEDGSYSVLVAGNVWLNRSVLLRVLASYHMLMFAVPGLRFGTMVSRTRLQLAL